MDDIVKAAMAKWPNVPDCYGWLGLDARGQWWLRDDEVQTAGPFAGLGANAASKGTRLEHSKLIAFIQRNYTHDESGQWFFQNGPQRVYVELEVAPWVWRVGTDLALISHTGQAAAPRACLLDEQGRVFFDTDLGLGLVHSQDMHLLVEGVEAGRWLPEACASVELEQAHGFVRSPQRRHAHAQPIV